MSLCVLECCTVGLAVSVPLGVFAHVCGEFSQADWS